MNDTDLFLLSVAAIGAAWYVLFGGDRKHEAKNQETAPTPVRREPRFQSDHEQPAPVLSEEFERQFREPRVVYVRVQNFHNTVVHHHHHHEPRPIREPEPSREPVRPKPVEPARLTRIDEPPAVPVEYRRESMLAITDKRR